MPDLNVDLAFRLIDEITAPLQKLADKLGGLEGSGKAASGELSGIGRASAQINKASGACAKATASARAWARANALIPGQYGKIGSESAPAVKKVADAMEGVAGKTKEATGDVHDLADEFRKLQDAARVKVAAKIEGAEKLKELRAGSMSAMKLGAGMSAAGGGILGGFAMAASTAMDQKAAMAQMRAQTLEADGSSVMDRLAPAVDKLVGFKSRADMTEMAFGMHQAGASEADIKGGGLQAARRIAVVGKMDNADAGQQLAALAQNAGAKDYGALADIVAKTQHGTGKGMGETMAAMTSIASKGANLGMSGDSFIKEISKTLTGLMAVNVDNGESVVQGVMDALPRLGEKQKHGGGWRTEETKGIMSKFGLGNLTDQLFDKEGNLLGKDGGEQWGNVMSVLDSITSAKDAGGQGIGDKDKSILLKELFGEGAAAGLMKFDLGAMNDANEKLAKMADIQQRENAILEETSSKWQAMKNAGSGALGAIGEKVLVVAGPLIEMLTSVIGWITEWTTNNPVLSGTIFAVVGVLGGLLAVGGALIGTVGMLGSALSNAQKGLDIMGNGLPMLKNGLTLLKGNFLGAAATAWSFAAALLANPITWIVVGIAALAVGAYMLIKHWDKVKAFFAGLWDWLTELWNMIPGWLQWFFPFIKIPVLIVQNWDKIKGFFKDTWDWLVGLWDQMPGWLQWFFPFIKIPALIVSNWDTIKGFFKSAWDWLTGLWNKIPGWMQWFFPLIKIPQLIIENWEKVKNFFKGIGDWISKPFKSKEVKDVVDAAKGPEVPGAEKAGAIAKAGQVKNGDKNGQLGGLASSDADLEKMMNPGGAKMDWGGQKADAKDKKGGEAGAVSIVIHYEPKMEFKGDVKESDVNWFKKQLEQHKEDIARMVRQQFDADGRWAAAR